MPNWCAASPIAIEHFLGDWALFDQEMRPLRSAATSGSVWRSGVLERKSLWIGSKLAQIVIQDGHLD